MAEAHDTAAALVAALREHAPGADISMVGSLRRGCETCGDLDILAAGAPASLMDAFTGYRLVERVLAHGETKSSVLLWGGFQADLRLVPRESLGAAQQYFTGSKAHNIALRDRAIQRGLQAERIRPVSRRRRRAGRRRDRGEASTRRWGSPSSRRSCARTAARSRPPSAGTLPRLDHARRTCAATCTCTRRRPTAAPTSRRWRGRRRRAGLELHRASPITARRWRWPTASTRRARSSTRARSARSTTRLEGITLLAGIECDIRADGTMDLADDCLAQLDIVIASVHSAFNQERGADDRPAAARHRVPVGRRPRPPDRRG